MTEDVGTTPRKPLNQRQRLALYEAHCGICALCGLKIVGKKWRDEHMRALGLGGSNDPDNRAPVHVACAQAKDKVDLPAIAKAKRVKAKHIGAAKAKRGGFRGWRKFDGTRVWKDDRP